MFIDRGNREHARQAFDGAAVQIKNERQSVFIFPEGTRSYSAQPSLLPFKKGAFHLAVQAQVPIVPVVVANYSNVLHMQTRRFRAGKIPIKGRQDCNQSISTDVLIVLPPIPTRGLTAADVDNLTKTTRDKMLSELVELTELARGQAVAVGEEQAQKLDSQHGTSKRAGYRSNSGL